ncbi:membrane-bound alpha-1,6- mannosyltransferase Initiation-specific [Rhizophlyctis rosea]|nr:membrane-bound alpha-1,6- mannosyltransferase Initiation-specific [Rhizophlyctis rosea]
MGKQSVTKYHDSVLPILRTARTDQRPAVDDSPPSPLRWFQYASFPKFAGLWCIIALGSYLFFKLVVQESLRPYLRPHSPVTAPIAVSVVKEEGASPAVMDDVQQLPAADLASACITTTIIIQTTTTTIIVEATPSPRLQRPTSPISHLYNNLSSVPNIHQTHKTYPSPNSDHYKWIQTFKTLNPTYEHRFYDDALVDKYMRDNLSQKQYTIWSSLSVTIQKMDIFRYILIYTSRGWYFDSDVECLKPIDTWIDRTREDVSFVAGLEGICPDYQMDMLPRRVQVTQWAFGASAGHPLMKRVIDHTLGREATLMGNMHKMPRERDTLDITGPGMFSDVVLAYLAELGAFVKGSMDVKSEDNGGVDEEGQMWLEETMDVWRVGDVRVYSSLAFNAGFLGRMVGWDHPMTYIMHHFAGSWK